MTLTFKDRLAPLFAKLDRLASLDAASRKLLEQAPWRTRRLDKGEYLEHQGGRPAVMVAVCDGVAIATKELRDGQQQNIALYMPGDMLTYESFLARRSGASVHALTVTEIMWLPNEEFGALLDGNARLRSAFWRDMAVMTHIMQEWMVGLGRRKAYQQVAHLLCEFHARMQNAGLGEQDACPFPLTQHDFADIAGLSIVHTNRTLQQLRRAGLIELKGNRLRLLDLSSLYATAYFDPAYLSG